MAGDILLLLFRENNGSGETCTIIVFVIVGLHDNSSSVEITKSNRSLSFRSESAFLRI